MAKLQGFRLVNIHANNNTIIYANEHFKTEGRNTLIDMKNGGGKTLAVQMLFQTILPNTYFEKQKNILRLFDDVSNGSTIHVVSHFSVENTQFKNVYLGFMAMSQPTIDGEVNEVSNAGIKYMTYIIEGNTIENESLTIDTLPLCVDDGSNIKPATYKEIKDFLYARKNNEKNGRYYNIKMYSKTERTKYHKELKRFGINSEVFEFLENINKDENYIKHFFEIECSKPKDLFMKFILENTQKALNAKDIILNGDNTDKAENLSKSLYESAKSLNTLNKTYKEKDQFKRLKEQISINVDFLKSKTSILYKYREHLQEYPKQASLLSNLILSESQRWQDIDSKKISLENELSDIKAAIKSIEFYLLLNEKNQLEDIYTEKEKNHTDCTRKISKLNNEKLEMDAENYVVGYRKNEQEKATIEEQIQKLTTKNYDEEEKLAEYSNAINNIAQKVIEKLNLEIDQNLKLENETTQRQSKLNQECGRIEFEIKQNNENLDKYTEQKEQYRKELSDISKELEDFPNFSGTMFDYEEQNELQKEWIRVGNFINSTKDEIDNSEDELKDYEKEMAVVENNIEHLKKSLSDNKEILDKIDESLCEVLSKTPAQEHTLTQTKAQLGVAIEKISQTLKLLNDEEKTLKEDITILEDYGFLRTKEKYDALKLLQNELNYAQFGSEILQDLNEKDPNLVDKILSKFPAFPECLVVSDDEYDKISSGKKNLQISVLKELFVIVKASFLKNFDDCEFNQMFLVSRDKSYYSKLLDPETAIETRTKRKLTIEKQHLSKSEEKNEINSKIDLITKHTNKYSIEYVQKHKELDVKIQNDLKTFELECFNLSNNIQKSQRTIKSSESLLEKLQKEKLMFEEKTTLLSQKINLNNKISEIGTALTSSIDKKSDLENSINHNKNRLDVESKEITKLSEQLKQLKKELNEYQNYASEVKNHTRTQISAHKEQDITVLIGKFRAAKQIYLEGGYSNIEDLHNKKDSLDESMESCKSNYIFRTLDFDNIYKKGILTEKSAAFMSQLVLKIDDLEVERKNLSKETGDARVNLEVKLLEVNKKKSEITIYFEQYHELSSDELRSNCEAYTEKLRYVIDSSSENLNLLKSCEESLKELEKESNSFTVFCEARNLNWRASEKAVKKIAYSIIYSENKLLEDAYTSAINSINSETKKALSDIKKLTIQEQLKSSLKDCLVEKVDFDNVCDRIKHLEGYIEKTDNMLLNLETSINGIGKIDDQISKQILRSISEILDEIERIPEYSKMKYDKSMKESFKINLNTETGCRWNDDVVLSNIKSYIFELANNIENDGLTHKDIKGKLTMNKMISFAVDFNKLNIQILKIDAESSKYYKWGSLIASSGESYVTYVMFVTTMIKYFNSVTISNNKMKSDVFIFLDNPFASASNSMLWNPVKLFLTKCNAQLLCTSHNPPNSAQILFDKHIIIEQARNSNGQSVNIIRNQKTESQVIMQMNLFDHKEI